MSGVLIDVINRTSILTPAACTNLVAALQIQVARDFAPVWNTPAMLSYVAPGVKPDPQKWWLTLLDDSDQAGALGYHEMTSAGMPIGKVFCKTTALDGGLPTVCASHELLEMLADPYIDRCVAYQTSNTVGRLYSLEVCDACEDDKYGYDINGVTVSDFVYPNWFEGWRGQHSAAQFDHVKQLKFPFELLPGGYISAMDFNGGGWQQLTGDMLHRSQFRAPIGSRRERRLLPRNFWRNSDLK